MRGITPTSRRIMGYIYPNHNHLSESLHIMASRKYHAYKHYIKIDLVPLELSKPVYCGTVVTEYRGIREIQRHLDGNNDCIFPNHGTHPSESSGLPRCIYPNLLCKIISSNFPSYKHHCTSSSYPLIKRYL